MPNYKDRFKLDINDIDLIEDALRTHAAIKAAEQSPDPVGQMTNTPEITRKVHDLLGKIHNQKNFYACVTPTTCPVG